MFEGELRFTATKSIEVTPYFYLLHEISTTADFSHATSQYRLFRDVPWALMKQLTHMIPVLSWQ
jgi:hypothetical protein